MPSGGQMIRFLYRLFMYIWTGSAAVYTVIAIQFGLAEAFVLALICAFTAWIFWLAGTN